MIVITLTPVTLGTGPDTVGSDSLYSAFTKSNGNDAALKAAIETASTVVEIVAKTSSYTLAIGDAGAVVEMNLTTANTVTIPTHASVAFPIGTTIEICQVGTGTTTIAGASGVTLRGPTTLSIRAQWSSVSLRKRGTNEWVLAGDFT